LFSIGESTSGVWETSKLGGGRLIWLFPIGVFTLFNYAPAKTQDFSIVKLPQIGTSPSGVWETSKLGGSRLIWLFPIGVFT
jgi:hypothetical protein